MAMCIDSTVSDILGKALHELKFTDLHKPGFIIFRSCKYLLLSFL